MNQTVQNMVRRRMSLAQLRSFPSDASASKIRKSFIDYFCESNNHFNIKSSPVFSLRDPTLAFVNAGMNQFKDVFLGLAEPPFPRVANSQKCIRIGGKHNDLSQVGNDGTHHTFFEMLGNWSFNDYFKKDACKMSWEFLTQVCGLPPERLYVTYFGGDEKLGVLPDTEVQEIWRELGVKESHILPFGVKDNFWEASVTGPCGPCTEIHYDHCPGRSDAANLVNSGSNELTELWNLVFIQYNRLENGELKKLENHYVDTGMGFERLVAILQGKNSNYDTDLFYPLFEAIQKITGHSGYTGKYDGNHMDCGYRILADHSRMISVALSDGMIPSVHNKVKKIIRKTITLSTKLFGEEKRLFRELPKYVAETLSDAYPEIGNNLSKIDYVLEKEENLLKNAIKFSVKKLEKLEEKYPILKDMDVTENHELINGISCIDKNVLRKGEKYISNETADMLLGTHGIPLEIVALAAQHMNLVFDQFSFEKYNLSKKKNERKMNEAKLQKNKETFFSSDMVKQLKSKYLSPTNDSFKYDYRVDESGKYIFKQQPSTIVGIVCGDKLVDEISSSDVQGDQEIGLVLDRTQFFSSTEKRISDSGKFIIENKIHFNVNKVVKDKGLVVHLGTFSDFPSNEKVTVESIGVLHLDENKRLSVMRNHTALHILNSKIKKMIPVFGESHSFVKKEKLSFTFVPYYKKFTENDIKEIEDYVKSFILHEVPVKTKILSLGEFQKLQDVAITPGESLLEKEVPIVEINSGLNLTRNYCKGTHVLNTADLKDFVITKYLFGQYHKSVIEACTGDKAAEIRANDKQILKKFEILKEKMSVNEDSKVEELLSEVEALLKEIITLERISYVTRNYLLNLLRFNKLRLEQLEKESRRNLAENCLKNHLEKNNTFVVEVIKLKNLQNLKDLRSIDVTKMCNQKPVMLLYQTKDNVDIDCFVPKFYVDKGFSAEDWVSASMSRFGVFRFLKKNERETKMFSALLKKISQEQLSKALELANAYAKRHFEKI